MTLHAGLGIPYHAIPFTVFALRNKMMKNWTFDYISVVINANLTILLADMPIDSWALGGGDKSVLLQVMCHPCI